MTEIQSAIFSPGLIGSASLSGNRQLTFLCLAHGQKRRSQFTKESHGGWLVNKTALSLHTQDKKRKNGERERRDEDEKEEEEEVKRK